MNGFWLLDKDFLKKVDEHQEREIYARITALDLDENLIEEITGRVTGGSVNLDGNSIVRRTCSLTIAANELNIHSYYWGLHTKFKLWIGMKNYIDSKYPDILWFKMGTYVISSFNTSQNLNSYNISISGKDKMTLLNGEFGGMLSGPHNFGQYDFFDSVSGQTVKKDAILKDVITDIVHEFAKEPLQNIIVKDMDDQGINLMEYKGNIPMYIIWNEIDGEVDNFTLDPNFTIETIDRVSVKVSDDSIIYNPFMELGSVPAQSEYSKFKLNKIGTDGKNVEISIIKVTHGQACGYQLTDLIYAGDFICDVGQFATSALDKIVALLGGFEYFYDVDGRFIFQRKTTSSALSWNSMVRNIDEEYADTRAYTSEVTYSFENGLTLTQIANNPAFGDLKNDFSIWGVRKSAAGSEIPIHMRYAIDIKPHSYKSYDGIVYTTKTMAEYVRDEAVSVEELKYKKQPAPFGLSDEWWDAMEWAELYKRYSPDHKYPQDRIYQYTTSKPPAFDLNQFISEKATMADLIYASPGIETSQLLKLYGTTSIPSSIPKNFTSSDLFVINGKYLTYHGGCTHYYEKDFLEWYKNGVKIYLYNPKIPNYETGSIVIPDYEKFNGQLDWREIIYQMAADFHKYNRRDDFYQVVGKNNPNSYPTGITGYEQYYTDILGFWRQLYDIAPEPGYVQKLMTKPMYDFTEELYIDEPVWVSSKEDREYHSGVNYFQKFEYKYYGYLYNYDLQPDDKGVKPINKLLSNSSFTGFYRKDGPDKFERVANQLLDVYTPYWVRVEDKVKVEMNREKWSPLLNECFYMKPNETQKVRIEWYNNYDPNEIYYTKQMPNISLEEGDKKFWNWDALATPELLNFWFDFLDPAGELSKYSVKAVGSRPKSVKDNNVKAIYFRETPNVIFVPSEGEERDFKPGYTYVKLQTGMDELFSLSAQGKTAKYLLDEYLYKYAQCVDNITFSSMPIYYLQPNTRIFIKDSKTGINGEYIITKISLPLTANGTMSITANKAFERIY